MVYRLTICYVFTPNVGWPQPFIRSGNKLSGKCNIGAIIAPYFNAAIDINYR